MARPYKNSLSKFHCNKIPFPNHNIPSNIGTMYTSSLHKKYNYHKFPTKIPAPVRTCHGASLQISILSNPIATKIPFPNHNIPSNVGTMCTSSPKKYKLSQTPSKIPPCRDVPWRVPTKKSIFKFHCNKIPFQNHNIPSNIGTMCTSSHKKYQLS